MGRRKACQVIHAPHWHSKESDGSVCFWLSLSEQFELFVLTCPITELCANVDVPFHYRLGFLSVGKQAGKSRVTPISGLGLLTLEFTGICFLYRESNASYDRRLSMVMTASFYSSWPIMIVNNVPWPRNLEYALWCNPVVFVWCLTWKVKGFDTF